MHPQILAFVDGAEVGRLEPPASLDRRAWLLAVAAVQLNADDGAVRPVLRLHVTGAAAPQLIDLDARAQVDIALLAPGAPPPTLGELTMSGLPAHPERSPHSVRAESKDAAARLAIAVDGERGQEAVLARHLLGAEPPPRAFGHVYSRWLRDGSHESGYDLTDFQPAARGVKFERIQSGPAVPPVVISYLISIG